MDLMMPLEEKIGSLKSFNYPVFFSGVLTIPEPTAQLQTLSFFQCVQVMDEALLLFVLQTQSNAYLLEFTQLEHHTVISVIYQSDICQCTRGSRKVKWQWKWRKCYDNKEEKCFLMFHRMHQWWVFKCVEMWNVWHGHEGSSAPLLTATPLTHFHHFHHF